MSGFFERMPWIRTCLLLLVCNIGFSAEAAFPFRYTQANNPNEELTGLQHIQRQNIRKKSVPVISDSDSIVYQLTPTLTVVTKPLGTAKNSAIVTFYSGSILLYTLTITQTAPVSVSNSDLILGSVKIDQGMQLTLQIPSSLQPGSVFLQATFSDLNIPPTKISAMIATWKL